MGIIRRFIGDKILEAAIKAGHVPANIPPNEEDRLKDLKRLKLIEENIEKDKRFSSFPKLAATLTGCSQSAIHIIDDDTQHCKVSYGKDLPTDVMTNKIPRQLAICSHVLNNNSKPLVINDVSLDERTKHAFELAPNFPRFYAGSPIISNTGYTLGTFCVFDDAPKALDPGSFLFVRQFRHGFGLSLNQSPHPASRQGLLSRGKASRFRATSPPEAYSPSD